MEGRQGNRKSGSVRRPSIRSAEAEERRRAYGVRDAGSAFRSPDRPPNPGPRVFRGVENYFSGCAAGWCSAWRGGMPRFAARLARRASRSRAEAASDAGTPSASVR